jgi:flagellar basal-body rod modification protein FlgD
LRSIFPSRAAAAPAQITAFDFSSCHRPLAESDHMFTTPIPTGGGAQGTQLKSKNFALKAEDFIKMMVTQLQNQDPTNPAKNDELLAQMSQIGQLQASTTLTDSIKGMVLQNQIGSAGNLIGKTVQGVDDQNTVITGVVNSVKVNQDSVSLELDNGKSLALGKVTSIAAAPASSRGVTAGLPPGSSSSTSGIGATAPGAAS